MGFMDALKSVGSRFVGWFKTTVKPEMLEFLDANKGLALEVVTKTAIDCAGKGSALKREYALNELRKHAIEVAPGVQVDNQWLGLLIEMALAVYKAQK
jgi:hypothetical protein